MLRDKATDRCSFMLFLFLVLVLLLLIFLLLLFLTLLFLFLLLRFGFAFPFLRQASWRRTRLLHRGSSAWSLPGQRLPVGQPLPGTLLIHVVGRRHNPCV